ncbi:MAG: hypothetical protein WAV40_03080 [Microgenomates group bacterium]
MNEDAAQITDLSKYIGNVLIAIIPLIGIISFIMILVGGFTFLAGAGNPDSMKKGKAIMGGAIAGIAMAIGSWLILLLIENITGARVTNFKLGL